MKRPETGCALNIKSPRVGCRCADAQMGRGTASRRSFRSSILPVSVASRDYQLITLHTIFFRRLRQEPQAQELQVRLPVRLLRLHARERASLMFETVIDNAARCAIWTLPRLEALISGAQHRQAERDQTSRSPLNKAKNNVASAVTKRWIRNGSRKWSF